MQAGLRLCCSRTSEDRFSRVEAQIIVAFPAYPAILSVSCADPEGRGGGNGPGPPLKNHKNIGFLSNTGPDPLTIIKLPSQHSMLGLHRHASKTPFNGVSLAG